MSKKAVTAIFALVSVLYPCLVYIGLQRWSFQMFGLLIIAVGAVRFALSDRNNSKVNLALFGVTVVCGIGIWCFPSELAVKLYPVLMSAFVGSLFAFSLRDKEALIEKVARLRGAQMTPAAVRYTRRLTAIWALVLYLNGGVALYLAHFATTQAWTLYCGFLSYVILGAFAGGELVFRHFYMRQQREKDIATDNL
jgi:uncharacterized membrane protein